MPAAMLSLWPAGIRGGAGGGGGTDGEGMVMLASGFSASVRASIEAEHTRAVAGTANASGGRLWSGDIVTTSGAREVLQKTREPLSTSEAR